MKLDYLLSLEGLDKKQALEKVKTDNLKYRIIEEDGKNYAITDDFDFTRINLEITDNIVINATVG